MNLIKEIRDLSAEIASLKESVKNYDKQISQAEATSSKLSKMFAGYKQASASAMSLKGLENATRSLANGYAELENAQDLYVKRQYALQESIAKLKEQQTKLPTAQGQALRNGDQEIANQLYQQYVANAQALAVMEAELQNAQSAMSNFNGYMAQNANTANHYADVLDAMKSAHGNTNIEQLNAMLAEEKKNMGSITTEMAQYVKAYEVAQEKIRSGKIAPEDMQDKQEELEGMRYKLAELSNAYTAAAERARVFSAAIGGDTEEISLKPDIEMPKEEIISEETLDNAKELNKELDGISGMLGDILKGGLALSGIDFGARSLVGFAKQVMNVRSEFQQLEIAFSTMLGSQDKALELMQQMTETAAKTPFDLQGVAQGAKQLLAYGIAADEINDTLVHLGDIAAGLSLPLSRLVYLYGTTMVQGRMYSMDLRQFMNAGIPLAEELAKQFGVTKDQVRELVTQGKVGAEQFKAAIMSMSSEGGKFGGLMEAQSKTINGQISNIKDKMDMMFNEIGENSEGAINTMLGGVGTLVEHYKDVGAAIMGLVSAIGAYKAISIVVATAESFKTAALKRATAATIANTAAQSANTASEIADSVATGVNTAATTLNTTIIWAHVKALVAERAAMLSNPYVLVTAVVIGLGVAIWKLVKAHQNEKTAIDKINDSYDKRLKNLRDEQEEVNKDINVLENEASALNDVLDARERLKKELIKSGNFTEEQVSAMSNEQLIAEIRKFQKEAEKVIQDENNKAVENYHKNTINENIEKFKKGKLGVVEESKQLVETSDWENPHAIRNVRTLYTEEHAKSALAEILKQDAELRGDEIDLLKKNEDGSSRATKEQIADLSTLQKAKEEQLALYRTEHELLSKKTELTKDEKNRWALLELEIARADAAVRGYGSAIDTLKNNDADSTNLQGILYGYTDKNNQLKNGIYAQEKEVERLRKIYAKESTKDNKTNFDGAVQELKRLTGVYKDMTGQEWVDTKEFEKQKTEETRKNARQREDIYLQEYSKRVQIATQKEREIEDLEKEKREWKEKNPTRQLPAYFAEREQVIELKFKAYFDKLDEEFNEWIEGIQRETLQINTEVEISQLEQAIELADDFNTKLEKRKDINEKQIEIKNRELDLDKEQTAENQFGKKTIERYSAYKSGEVTDISTNEKIVFDQLERFYQEFENKRNAIIGQMKQEHSMAILQDDLSEYEAYCQEIIAAAQEREEAIAAINRGEETNRTIDMVEKDYKLRIDKAAITHGIDAAEKNASDIVARLVNSLADVTYEQVDAAATEFFSALKKQEDMLAEVKGMSEEDRSKTVTEKQADLDKVNLELESPLLTEELKIELLAQRAELEQQLIYLKMTEMELDGEAVKLLGVRKQMENLVVQTKSKSGKKTIKEIEEQNKKYRVTIQTLQLVSDTARQVADTFGGALSKKSKKALNTMSGMAEFGISAIQGIETLVNGVSACMIKTTEEASKAMQTLEKASFILTVISIAVQLITKIVEIASQFTKSAKLQDSIDAHIERVDELKRQNEQLQRAYQDKTGIDYYIGMTKAAKDYERIIREQNKALADARKLYELQARKYGEDSDKAKEAKEQMNEIEDDLHDTMDTQAEQLQEVANSLATTDLSSFSQSLAESIVDGFANGAEGIEDAFDDMLDDLYRSMLTKQLSMALEKEFGYIFDKISAKANDSNALTQSEIEEIIGDMEKAKENAKHLADAYYDVFSQAGLLDDADAEGSQGFGQMTQDQADTLTARFTALQIEGANISAATQAMAAIVSEVGADAKLNVASLQTLVYNSNISLQIAQDQLDQMITIADNTGRLADIESRLKTIEQNTGRL